ncbi:unnamed protein product [Brassica oleracea]|uniref:Uncharacterized protein n=1 Tax=Brassica oleracea TaxID=3712 RepID=A0A3P6DQE6_BRAOL|nr:unnamed protein product [Brassica oleracea]
MSQFQFTLLGNETIGTNHEPLFLFIQLTTNKLSELACLALYLMYEKKQGKKSNSIVKEDVESPLLWSEAELEYLTGSPTKVLQLVFGWHVIHKNRKAHCLFAVIIDSPVS